MSKAKNQVSNLLAAIKRHTPDAPVHSVVPEAEPIKVQVRKTTAAKPETPVAPKKAVKSKVGKAVQFWMHDEDKKLVRELSAWLAGQGVRPSDSMVIRACLRYAKEGGGFLEAYWQAAKLDGRLKRD
jgi:hypothetical protein